jgi:hypothetical protein
VWFINAIYKKLFGQDMDSQVKFIIAVLIAFGWSYIPMGVGNDIVARIRDAVGIATGMAGLYQFSGGVASKVKPVIAAPVIQPTVEPQEPITHQSGI